jgi:hypothetical protein
MVETLKLLHLVKQNKQMILSEQTIKAIKGIKDGKRHKNYDHTVKLANDYKALMTGDKDLLKDYLRILKKRENEEDRMERIQLTEFINKSVGEHLTKTVRKLMRISNIHMSVKYNSKEQKATGIEVVEFMSRFERFSEEGDVDGYIEEDLIMQSIIDPNTFVVISKFDSNGVEMPYAKDIPSKNIFDYSYSYGELQMLNVETSQEEKKELSIYYVYTKDEIIILREIDKQPTLSEFDYIELTTGQTIKLKERYFTVEVYETKLGVVPAFRIGFKSDIRTNRETRESFIDPAVPYLKKLVGSVSEFDLANLKHAFPRLFGYERKCPGQPMQGKHCDNGKIKTDGTDCSVCKGRGILVPESSMDSITLPLPKDPSELHDLSKLSHSESTDIELLRYMKETIVSYVQDAEESIYGVVSLGRKEIAKTATEKMLEQESISDALEPFAKAISKWWRMTHYISAKLLRMDKGIVIEHQYPRNLRIQSVSEMIDEIKVLKDSGADSIFLEAIQDEVAEKRFIDKPSLLKKYRVYREHKPFNGDTDISIQYKIANNLVTKRDSVLWANFIDIMEQVENDQSELGLVFIDLPKEKRIELIEAKLEEYLEKLNELTVQGINLDGLSNDLQGDEIPTNIDIEAEAKAKIKGTVGGVQGIIGINKAVSMGEMTEESAEQILVQIYGFPIEIAKTLIEKVPAAKINQPLE